MKKLNKTLSVILAILMVLSIIPITASAATLKYAGDSVFWDIKNGVLMIYGSGEMYSYTSSTVPWSYYKDKIKEISIDEDITSIGDYAFYGLNITEVEIPEGIRKIGTCAFANCTSLSKVVIRKGVNIIDTNAFANCKSLKNVYYYSPQNDWGLINIRTGNNDLLNAELFVNGNGKISWEYEQETGTLTFSGNGVIPDYYIDSEELFLKQPWDDIEKDIKHLVFNEGITSIGEYAFAHCSSLETITMSSVETISTDAFNSCVNLKAVTTSNSLKVIGDDAFYECDKLTYIYYLGTQNEWSHVKIGDHWNDEMDTVKVYPSDYAVYSDCGTDDGLTGENTISWTFDANTYTLIVSGEGKMPNDISIDELFLGPFYKYTGIRAWDYYKHDTKKVVVDNGITYIGKNSFRFFLNLTEVVIPASVTEIYNMAFRTCDSITDVYYTGTEEQWRNIVIGEDNDALLNATIHYNYVECVHNYETSIVTPPTCSRIGYTTRICSICSGSCVDEIVDCIPHPYTTVVTAPTCTKRGYTTYTCPDCGDIKDDDYVDATGHNYQASATVSPTCTASGYIKYTCANGCGTTKKETTESALGHDYSPAVTFEPTCTEKGYSKQTCTRCKDAKKYDYVDALGHDYVLTSTTAPTCTVQGCAIYQCSLCDATKTEYYADAKGHNYEWTITVEPTCTVDGTQIGICLECGYETTGGVSRLGHDWYDEYEVDYAPTCTKDGQESRHCSRCNWRLDARPIPAGHPYGEWEQVDDAKCGEYGRFEHFCSLCGQIEVMNAPVDHDYSIENVVVEATCTTEGSKTLECSCGVTKTETIPATGHHHKPEITIPATHLEEGLMTFICACGDTYTGKIEKLEKHNFESVVTAPTCTEQGYTTYTCECGESYVGDYVDALGHKYSEEITTPATHLTEGLITYTCACGDSYTETIEKIAEHNYDTVVTAPTCTERGYTTYTCECGDSYVDDYVDALGHTPSTAFEENYVAPTCTENGSKDVVVYCSVCDEEISIETVIINAIGHADNDGDGYCDACDELLDPTIECECNCHNDGISGFFWKIKIFFSKLFRTNKMCKCGVAHY